MPDREEDQGPRVWPLATAAERDFIAFACCQKEARLCLALARAVNGRDAHLMEGQIAAACEWQPMTPAPREPIRGAAAVLDRLGSWLATLPAPPADDLCSAELGMAAGRRACVILLRRGDQFSTRGLGGRWAEWVITADEAGRLARLYEQPALPPPEGPTGTGIFPGIPEDRLREALVWNQHKVPRGADLRFVVFAAGHRADAATLSAVARCVGRLPGSSWRVVPGCAEEFKASKDSPPPAVVALDHGHRRVAAFRGPFTEDDLWKQVQDHVG